MADLRTPSERPAPEAAWSDVNGTRLAWAGSGQGAPLLLLHGLAADHRAWEPHVRLLGQHHRAMALTQRCFGTQDWADGGASYSMQTHVDDLAAFVAQRGCGPVHLAGWSYGGAVALAFAVQHPRLVASLFTYDMALASFITDPNAAQQATADRQAMVGAAAAAVKAGDLEGAVRALLDGACAQPGAFDALEPRVRAVMLDNARMLALQFKPAPAAAVDAGALAALRVPAMFAIGGQTRLFYRLASLTAARLVPGARCEEIPIARHLWPVQDPPGFCRALQGFIDGLPPVR